MAEPNTKQQKKGKFTQDYPTERKDYTPTPALKPSEGEKAADQAPKDEREQPEETRKAS